MDNVELVGVHDDGEHLVLAGPDGGRYLLAIDEPLRATLEFLGKVTRDRVTADDVRALRALGLSRTKIEDALNVAFAFNVITRLADTFEFHVGPPETFASAARMLLKRGYR